MALTASPTEEPVDARVVRTRNDILTTTLQVLVDEGREAVTHNHVARVAGYSRATVYKHWPTRSDLLYEAFAWLRQMPHHAATGNLRNDLIAELTMFRAAIEDYHLDQLLAVLAELASSDPRMAVIRDEMVRDGEAPLRTMLATVADGERFEAAALMLSGFVSNAAMMHDTLPSDALIAAAVDIALLGIAHAE
ncbi:TetR/AcrR family transcriptional regulator [Dermatophilaceae bacterium Sec6.4]